MAGASRWSGNISDLRSRSLNGRVYILATKHTKQDSQCCSRVLETDSTFSQSSAGKPSLPPLLGRGRWQWETKGECHPFTLLSAVAEGFLRMSPELRQRGALWRQLCLVGKRACFLLSAHTAWLGQASHQAMWLCKQFPRKNTSLPWGKSLHSQCSHKEL